MNDLGTLQSFSYAVMSYLDIFCKLNALHDVLLLLVVGSRDGHCDVVLSYSDRCRVAFQLWHTLWVLRDVA